MSPWTGQPFNDGWNKPHVYPNGVTWYQPDDDEPEQPKTHVPIVPVRPVSMEPVHEYPERHVHPVTYVHPEQVIESEERTDDSRATKPIPVPNSIRPINSAKPDQTIRKNSDPGSKAELIPNSSTEFKPKPTQPITAYKRVGRVGRQRKNEEEGEHGENPVREVVIYRHVRGRQYPALSSDMKRWYEFFYFRKPEQGEKPFNANTSYEQHVEAYERGRRWIEAETAASVGDSRIVDMQARRAIR